MLAFNFPRLLKFLVLNNLDFAFVGLFKSLSHPHPCSIVRYPHLFLVKYRYILDYTTLVPQKFLISRLSIDVLYNFPLVTHNAIRLIVSPLCRPTRLCTQRCVIQSLNSSLLHR